MQLKVGILLFDEVEVLDFAGPFEVFSLAEQSGVKVFSVVTVGETGAIVHARNGLAVLPQTSFANCPALDVLIVPGGYGAEEIEVHNQVVLSWIAVRARTTAIIASICTGAFLLAKAGVLTNQPVTTHWMDIERLQREYPSLQVRQNTKYVDAGAILTSGGISAGIELSFHIVERLAGPHVAATTARRMEYDRSTTG